MKRLMAFFSVAMVALILTGGCQRKGQSSAQYDPQKSPPPSAINVKEDPGLLADQAGLSAAIDRAKPVTTAPAGATPATTLPVEATTTTTPPVPSTASEVAPVAITEAETAAGRDAYLQVRIAIESGKREDILEAFNQKDIASLIPILNFDTVNGKMIQELQEVASKNDVQLPPSILTGIPATTKDSPIGQIRLTMPNEIKVSKRGADLLVADINGVPLVIFTKNGEKWVANVTEKGQATLVSLAPKCDAAIKLISDVLAGINNKTITKENVTEKVAELSK